MSGAAGRRWGGLWRQRDYRRFWVGETTSRLGTAVTSVALPLLAVIQLHADALQVSLIAAASWLPWALIGLPAGVLADRMRRRRLLIAADLISAVLLLTIPLAAWLHHLTMLQLILVPLAAGASAVLFKAARPGYLRTLVERDQLAEANAKLTGSSAAAQVGGPGLGGALVQLVGPAAALIVDSASYMVSLVCLLRIQRSEPVPPRTAHTSGVTQVREGLAVTFGDRHLRPITLFGAAANLSFTGLEAILVVFLVRDLGLSAAGVGAVFAIESAGGILGALLAGPLGRRVGTARLLVFGTLSGLPFALLVPLGGHGIGILPLLIGEFLVTAAVTTSNVVLATFTQSHVPPHLMGRVQASMGSVSYSCMPVGAALAGVLANWLGVHTAVWVMAASVPVCGLILLTSPGRTLRDLPTTTLGDSSGSDQVGPEATTPSPGDPDVMSFAGAAVAARGAAASEHRAN